MSSQQRRPRVSHRRQARQLDIVHPKAFQFPVTIIGLGAIGSNTARVLSQLGCTTFRFFDGDVVGLENLGVQFYREADVGRIKVDACREVLESFLPGLEIAAYPFAYEGGPLDGVVVAGVDSMHARSTIWAGVREAESAVSLFLDGRTAGEELNVYTVRPWSRGDVRSYEESLVPDECAAVLPCTAQGAPHAQAVIAGIIGTQLVRWVRGEPYARFMHVNLRTYAVEVDRVRDYQKERSKSWFKSVRRGSRPRWSRRTATPLPRSSSAP